LSTWTFPPISDALTENCTVIILYYINGVPYRRINTPYGYWEVGYVSITADDGGLDSTVKHSGLYSIRSTGSATACAAPETSHWFYPNIDLSMAQAIHFMQYCPKLDGLDPSAWLLTIYDTNVKKATVKFGCVFDQWVSQDIQISQLTVDEGFDWSNIMEWNVRNDTNPCGTSYSWWIDEFYFWASVPDGTLRIESKPTGINGNKFVLADGTYNFMTPSQIVRPVNTAIEIQMYATDQTGDPFDHWADLPSTDPQYNSINRQWIFQQGISILTAVYGSALLPALSLDSYDQNMKTYPASQGVKFVFSGIEDFHDLPFGGRVSKGIYTFVPQNTSERTFKYWLMPDGTQKTDAYITYDVEADTKIEVHWEVAGQAPSIPWLPIAITILLVGGGVVAYIGFSKKPK